MMPRLVGPLRNASRSLVTCFVTRERGAVPVQTMSTRITQETPCYKRMLLMRPFSVSSHSSPSSRTAAAAEKIYSVANISAEGNLSITSLNLPEILRNSSLHARDLFSLALTGRHEADKRKRLSGAAARTPAAILPRGDEIVLSFGYVRALIGRDRGRIFDAHAPGTQLLAAEIAKSFEMRVMEDRKQRWRKMTGFVGSAQEQHEQEKKDNEAFNEDIIDWHAKMHSKHEESFELVFIEAVLRDTCDMFNRRLRLYEPIVDTLLTRSHNEVFSDSGVQYLVPLKDSLQEFELNVSNCLECLTHLLDNDEDMLALLLTEKHMASVKGEDLHHRLHERVELLLEEYARQLASVVHEIHFLLKRIQSKQELIAISLDSYRNRMIRMNVYLAVFGVGLATSTTVAGYFGMNLISGFEESPTAFNSAVLLTSAVTLGICYGCLSYLSGARMQKRAIERIEEIQKISGALSDMESVDYAIKTMLNENKPMDKKEFTFRLSECRPIDSMKQQEVDFLFHILDGSQDGHLYTSDFRSIENFSSRPAVHLPPQPPQAMTIKELLDERKS